MKIDNKPKHGIPFGWHVPSQRMLSATEVINGRACECTCIACGARLKARQGDVRTWHFAHDEDTKCQHAPEAAIHRMAKQMIAERGAVFVSALQRSRQIHGKRNVWSETISVDLQKAGLQVLIDCVQERTVSDAKREGDTRRPDLLATLDGLPLAIEIRNTHAVDFEKQEWLEKLGLSVLEITVTDIAQQSPEQILEALEQRLFQSADYSKWLVHAKEQDALIALNQLEEEVRAARKDEEQALLAELEAEEAARKRREEARKRYQDHEDYKIGLGRCTIRIGRNDERVSLKAYGYAPDDVFDGIKQVARKHLGRFNSRARCWEFYRYSETEAFFKQFRVELQQVCLERFCGVKPVSTQATCERRQSTQEVERPLPVYFEDHSLQEAFDERAGIFEFDAGLPRDEAEALALKCLGGSV